VRRILTIAGLDFQQMFRDRGQLVSIFVLPLLLTWVFGLAFGAGGSSGKAARVPIADHDRSVYSAFIARSLDQTGTYVAAPMSEAEARAAVRSGDSPVAVIVPAGFGRDVERGTTATVTTVRDSGSTEAQAIVEVVRGATARIATNAKAAHVTGDALTLGGNGVYPANAPDFRTVFSEADRFWSPTPPVGTDALAVRANSTHTAELTAPANTQYSLGFTVFFVLNIAFSGAGGLLEEREHGTLRRLLATPASRFEIVGGKVGGVAAMAGFEAMVLVGFGATIFGVPWGTAPLAVAAVLGSLVLACTGLAIMCSVLVRTRSQLSALAPALTTSLAMLGGCYWPTEITPPFMQKLALATPTGWAMVGLKNTVARGMGLDAVVMPCAVLLGMALLFFAVGLSRLRLE
jgi:ABC-2 type transport system permease protein